MSFEKIVVNVLLECIESCVALWRSDSDIMRRLRARARSLGSEYFGKGLAYLLTLVAARSHKDAIDHGLSRDSCREVVEAVRNLRLSTEELSYALYGAILAHTLRRTGLVQASRFSDLVKQALSDPVLDTRTWVVIDWLKRLVEAYVYTR